MQGFSRFAAATSLAGLMTFPAVALAQTTPDSTAPAATTAPATTTAPAATTTSTPPSSAQTDTTEKASPKKKKPAAKKMTRQQEIDHSIDSGTVPSRYRSSVPKEYQQYIPFDKR
jgi:hypothetical protein